MRHLSVCLGRVRSGETLEVAARRRPVAVLAPIDDRLTPIERLVSSGHGSVPEGDLLKLDHRRRAEREALSQALQEPRAERS